MNASSIKINGTTYKLNGHIIQPGDEIAIGYVMVTVGNNTAKAYADIILPYELDETVDVVTVTSSYLRGNGTSKANPSIVAEITDVADGDRRRIRLTISETVTKYMVYFLASVTLEFDTSEEDADEPEVVDVEGV